MRFPLIVLVLIAHSAGGAVSSLQWPSDDMGGTFVFVSEMISRHLCPIGVCWFYIFSGYFFFRNLQDGDFCMRWVLDKWKKRSRSLLIPFVFWNLLVVLFSLVISKAYVLFGIVPTSDPIEVVNGGPLYWFLTGPADFPLYFLRDLMIMSFAAPVIYHAAKKTPVLSLVVLMVFYLSCLTPAIPHWRSVFFFSLGAWLGIHKCNLLSLCRKMRIPAAIFAILLLPLSTFLIGHPSHELVRRLFFPFGMITMMNICDRWINNEKVLTRLSSLSATVFFIFAAHEVFILGWTKGTFLRIFGNSLTGMWISYLFVPWIVLGICLGLYWILNKLFPKTLAFVCGGRLATLSVR